MACSVCVACSGRDGAGRGGGDAGAVGVDTDGLLGDAIGDVAGGCAPACLPGYTCFDPGDGPRCVVSGAASCAPCQTQDDCLAGICTQLDDDNLLVPGAPSGHCLAPCTEALEPDANGIVANSCGPGLVCAPAPPGSGVPASARFCVPFTGSCTCTLGDTGATAACIGKGGCEGSALCTKGGWTPCDAPAPATESCDGLDEDCDGETDEALPDTGAPCLVTNDLGACPGVQTCDGAAGWRCEGEPAAEETCDGLDEDCDGETDEPWRVPVLDAAPGAPDWIYASDEHCGACGNACAALFGGAPGACLVDGSPPYCVLGTCPAGSAPKPDGSGCVAIPDTPCTACNNDAGCPATEACVGSAGTPGVPAKVCAPPCSTGCASDEVCSTVQSANGPVDVCLPTEAACTCGEDNSGALRACQAANVHGACVGLESCAPGEGWLGCTAKTPAPETCDGVDEDCDGLTDEDVPGDGGICNKSNVHGTCVGILSCKGPGGLVCSAKSPAPETCNGVDDNCDGAVDDGFADPITGAYLGVEHCGACGNACPGSAAPGTQPICVEGADGGGVCDLGCLPGKVDANLTLEDGCECTPVPGPDLPDGSDQNCDGVDGDVALGVFVSKDGKDENPGTRTQPVRTITKGIALAVALGRRDVYVGGGTYTESVELAAGVSVYGGYGEGFLTRLPLQDESIIVGNGNATGAAIAVRGFDINAANPDGAAPDGALWPTRLDGLTILGPTATSPGASSYAVHLSSCDSRLKLTACRLLAGVGADGPAGNPGTQGQPGGNGGEGEGARDIGKPVCSEADHAAPGVGGPSVCLVPNGPSLNVSGGKGGEGICPDYDAATDPPSCPLLDDVDPVSTAQPIESGADGLGSGELAGGVGGATGGDAYTEPQDGVTTTCPFDASGCQQCSTGTTSLVGKDGGTGNNGAHGGGGAGCSGEGVVVFGFWVGAKAAAGDAGLPGTGGGGGGAAGGVETVACENSAGFDDIGGAGGGGGGGGCGGAGGLSGGPGGGAFALMVVNPPSGDAPLIEGNVLEGGVGGAGGAGGIGGAGGKGGKGGLGGPDAAGELQSFCAYGGGRGGDGGSGGSGGGGGGGCGGPAILLLSAGVPSAVVEGWQASNTLTDPGQGGAGGKGGIAPGGAGLAGSSGPAVQVKTF